VNIVFFVLVYSPASEFYVLTFRNTLLRLQRSPKRRHIKFRSLGITQKERIQQKIRWLFFSPSTVTCLLEKRTSLGGKRPYMEWCSRKENSGIAWLLTGVWQMKGMRRNTDKVKCPLCLCEDDVRHTLLDCWETRYWRKKYLNGKWSNVNKDVAQRKN
jgi:hypothetical protein